MATVTLDIHSIPDNRGGASKKTGKRVPLVHIMLTQFGDVHSVAFDPSRAEEIAEAILKAGRAAKRNRRMERTIDIADDF